MVKELIRIIYDWFWLLIIFIAPAIIPTIIVIYLDPTGFIEKAISILVFILIYILMFVLEMFAIEVFK